MPIKIFVHCDGGLGNQLFEYAFGRSLSIRTGGELIIDTWRSLRGRSRPFQLDHFNIKARLPTKFENIICRLVDSPRLRAASRMIRRIAPGSLPTVVRQRQHGFDPKVFEYPGSVFLDGWWQSELYFHQHRDVILSELKLRDPPTETNLKSLDQIRNSTAVCVHVRRGDYVTDPFIFNRIGVCGLEYYQSAINLIGQRVASPTFFVFSDDPEWTRQNLPVPEPRHFISHNCGVSDWEDLRLMSACRHFIIANSTFSWWGAWLCAHSQKFVIAPERWFANSRSSTKDIVPREWTVI